MNLRECPRPAVIRELAECVPGLAKADARRLARVCACEHPWGVHYVQSSHGCGVDECACRSFTAAGPEPDEEERDTR
jgi:hypothetical protein